MTLKRLTATLVLATMPLSNVLASSTICPPIGNSGVCEAYQFSFSEKIKSIRRIPNQTANKDCDDSTCMTTFVKKADANGDLSNRIWYAWTDNSTQYDFSSMKIGDTPVNTYVEITFATDDKTCAFKITFKADKDIGGQPSNPVTWMVDDSSAKRCNAIYQQQGNQQPIQYNVTRRTPNSDSEV